MFCSYYILSHSHKAEHFSRFHLYLPMYQVQMHQHFYAYRINGMFALDGTSSEQKGRAAAEIIPAQRSNVFDSNLEGWLNTWQSI